MPGGSVAHRKNPPRGGGQVTSLPNARAQRLDHHVALLLVVAAQQRQLPLQDAAAARFVDQPLIEAAGEQIFRLLGHLELRGDRRGASIQATRKPGASVFEKLLR